VLTSAEEGVAKPAPALFLRALARLGDPDPAAVVHCGDDLRADVEGARAAGLQAVLVDREGGAGAPAGVRVVRSLAGLLPGAR
jgi:putative hydrolase of the HAD superfamily